METLYFGVGSTITLPCPFIGMPSKIQWIYRNKTISEGTLINPTFNGDMRYKIVGDNGNIDLQIYDLSIKDIGNYRCVTVQDGVFMSHTIELKLNKSVEAVTYENSASFTPEHTKVIGLTTVVTDKPEFTGFPLRNIVLMTVIPVFIVLFLIIITLHVYIKIKRHQKYHRETTSSNARVLTINENNLDAYETINEHEMDDSLANNRSNESAGVQGALMLPSNEQEEGAYLHMYNILLDPHQIKDSEKHLYKTMYKS